MSFWLYAFQTNTYTINKLPTHVLSLKSPYEVLYHKRPEYHHLKTFGCACYAYLHLYNAHKLHFRSKQCIFIGYSSSHKGYLCLDHFTSRIYVSRRMIFNEHHFPFPKTSPHLSPFPSIASHPHPTIPLVSTYSPPPTTSQSIPSHPLPSSPSPSFFHNSSILPSSLSSLFHSSPESLPSSPQPSPRNNDAKC